MNIAKNFGKESLTIPGVYQIVNKLNGHKYIGSSINIWTRWGRHLSDLRKNKHDNNYLQNAWNKYGEDNFEFGVLLFCDAAVFQVMNNAVLQACTAILDRQKKSPPQRKSL
mgnify:CR=1 FL=1